MRLLLIGILFILGLDLGAQQLERFPEPIESMRTGLPLIEGYSESDSAKHLYLALDRYLADELKEFSDKQGSLLIGGSGQFLITISSDHVEKVEVVTANSLVFARQVEGLLFKLPLKESEDEEDIQWVIPYTLDQAIGCCDDGNFMFEALQESLEASEALTLRMAQENFYMPDSMRWAVRTDSEGRIECIVMTENSPREWNDIIIKEIGTLSERLPKRKGIWIIGYYPRRLRTWQSDNPNSQ